VAQAADSDPWRGELRAAVAQADPVKRLAVLQTLAREARFAELSAVSLDLLGQALDGAGDAPGAATVLRKAQQGHPSDVWVSYDLAQVLEAQGHREEALRYYLAARALRPETAHDLAHALEKVGEPDQAIAVFEDLVRLRPRDGRHLSCLGLALQARGRSPEAARALDAAVAALQEQIRRKPDDALAHTHLGGALYAKGQLDEAIAEYRQALASHPKDAPAHTNLGTALQAKGQVDQAIACYRQALAINPKDALAHNNLGTALHDKGQVDEAIAEYRQALALYPKLAEAHCNLGHALRQQGRFGEALASLKRGHELGSRDPRWSYPSAQWVQQAQRLATMEPKLPALLKGEAQPTDTERLGLAEVCQIKHLHRDAARFYAEAFIGQPRLADDLQAWHRYTAACVATLAAAGAGADAATLGNKERTDLRHQALDWLRADLKAWAQSTDRFLVQRTLRHWQQDTDLASVRDKEALAKLPQAERDAWHKLWADVAALLEKSGGKK
jgi:tetratricopeptide (TPR) repeat protein